jgi:hypothetical protein
MQYNEDYMLPVFLDHYSRFLDPKHIKVIDHGSTIKQEHSLDKYERIYIPRSRPFSEGSRLRIIQHFVSGLLEYYDFGIFVDCDELIDLTNIKDISFINHKIHHVAGFDVFFRNTVNGLRLHGLFNPSYCKPSIFSYVPYWTAGFHEVDSPINMLNIPMIHTSLLYKKQAIDRLNIRSKVYQNVIEHEKEGGVAIHWDDGLSRFNSFYDYVNSNSSTQPKSFSPIDPIVFSDHTERDKGYKFSNVEYDLTEKFPHIVSNYNIWG